MKPEQFSEKEERVQIPEVKEKKSWREIGRERRKEKMDKTVSLFRGLGQRIGDAIRRIGRAGVTVIDIGYAFGAPEVRKEAAEKVGEVAVAAGRGVRRAGVAVGEAGLALGRGVRKEAEIAAAFVLEEMGKGKDWTSGRVKDVSRWLGKQYGEMKDFVATNLEMFKEEGRKAKETFLSKVKAARVAYTEWRLLWRKGKQEKKIEKLQRRIEKTALKVARRKELKAEAEKALATLRGVHELATKIEAAEGETA